MSGRILVIVVFALFCIILLCVYVVLRPRNYSIEYVIPAGYRGTIEIVEDDTRGVDPTVTSDNIVYSIPRSGVLLVKDLTPFGSYHQVFAKYANSARIATMNSKGFKDDTTIMLREVGATVTDERKVILHVGTLSEYKQCQKQYGFAR